MCWKREIKSFMFIRCLAKVPLILLRLAGSQQVRMVPAAPLHLVWAAIPQWQRALACTCLQESLPLRNEPLADCDVAHERSLAAAGGLCATIREEHSILLRVRLLLIGC